MDAAGSGPAPQTAVHPTLARCHANLIGAYTHRIEDLQAVRSCAGPYGPAYSPALARLTGRGLRGVHTADGGWGELLGDAGRKDGE